jgi:hypothetical protein
MSKRSVRSAPEFWRAFQEGRPVGMVGGLTPKRVAASPSQCDFPKRLRLSGAWKRDLGGALPECVGQGLMDDAELGMMR